MPDRSGARPARVVAVDSEAVTELGTSGRPAEDDEGAWPGRGHSIADRFQLEERIASGGAAIVWRAFDATLSRSVAVKILHPYLAADDTTVERFQRESRAAAQLVHNNVVRLYDTGHEDDIVYLVMEFVDGPSLADIMRERGQLDPLVVAALGEQVASALGEAHEIGLVHRDVKPANILLTAEGVPKMTDFGIAKALSADGQTLTEAGLVIGTAAYVSPEQVDGDSVDARADVYSLGLVLHECLTGRTLFQGDTHAATAAARLAQDVLPPRQIRADVPRALDDILVRATRRDRDQRYPDGAALAAMLAPLVPVKPSEVTAALVAGTVAGGDDVRVAVDFDPGPMTTGPMPTTRGEYARRLLMAFVGGLLLAVIAVVGVLALREEPVGGDSLVRGGIYPVHGSATFDPWGDGDEHNDQVPQATDRTLTTAWTTETYRDDARFGGVKPGAGIYFDLGSPREVHTIVLDVVRSGADVELYAVDELPDEVDRLVGWGRPIASLNDLALNYPFTLPTPTTGRYWLLWITELTTTGDGTFQAAVAEVAFHGR